MATAPKTGSDEGDQIMAELEEDSAYDENRVPLDHRIAYVRAQISEWQGVAFNSKVAFQTNRAIGLTAEELAPYVRQFSRARAATKELEARLADLEAELAAQGPPAARGNFA